MFKKLRKGADERVAPKPPADSIEAMGRRARHRLIGAVVLVLAAVIGFPILFDTQPRPVAVDIPIEIPDRNKVKPLPPLAPPPAAVAKVTPESAIITEPKEAATPVAPAAPRPAASEPKPAVAEKKPEPKPEAKAEPKPAAVDEAAKARALLEGKSVETAAAAGERFVVQVGAFAETDKARLAQQKLQRAGLKNYTNVAETKDGKRIRVRAGPFASRAEAVEAAEKIKGLDLPAAILTL
ncbi:MAG: SPOR domain-containing protein [Ramlibacter sp.]